MTGILLLNRSFFLRYDAVHLFCVVSFEKFCHFTISDAFVVCMVGKNVHVSSYIVVCDLLWPRMYNFRIHHFHIRTGFEFEGYLSP